MTTRELAKEIFDLTEELRLLAKIMRLEKEEDLIDHWEQKIIEAKNCARQPDVAKSVCECFNPIPMETHNEGLYACRICLKPMKS